MHAHRYYVLQLRNTLVGLFQSPSHFIHLRSLQAASNFWRSAFFISFRSGLTAAVTKKGEVTIRHCLCPPRH
jgi:hypothetical protein